MLGRVEDIYRKYPWREKDGFCDHVINVIDCAAYSKDNQKEGEQPGGDRETDEVWEFSNKAWGDKGSNDASSNNDNVDDEPDSRHVMSILEVDDNLECDIGENSNHTTDNDTLNPCHINESTNKHTDSLS